MSYAPLTSEPPVVVRVDDCVQTESPKVSSATPSSPVAFRKSWRGGLLDCFGDCSSSDFGSCCLVFWVPFVAFGANMRKAFALSFIQQLLIALGCLYGAQFVTELFASINCGAPPVAVGPMSGIDSSDVTATDVQAVKAYNSCTAVWNLLYMLYIPLGLGFLVYGAWRRQQMRRKFNIPGDEWADYASWLCCFPCALCQETRTLAGNEVEDGSWPAHKGNGNGEGQPLLFGTPSLGGRREAPQPNKMSV